MKFAVAWIPRPGSRSPPNEIRGTFAVAVLPTGFVRRSSILFVSLTFDGRWLKLVDHDADQLALCAAERRDDCFHAVVDIEACRQDRDQASRDVEQLAIGRAPRHRGPIKDNEIVAAIGARLGDRLLNGFAR